MTLPEPYAEQDSPQNPSTDENAHVPVDYIQNPPKDDNARGQSDDSLQGLPQNDDARGPGDGAGITKSPSSDGTTPGSSYASQGHMMEKKASASGIRMSYLETILIERRNIAQNRFPSENTDWQEWWAEASTWGTLCILP